MKRSTWHRVKAPTPWRPEDGEELIGHYRGSKTRQGEFGEYLIHFIEARDIYFYVSGSMLNDLFTAVKEGDRVRLVFLGRKRTENDRELKVFELYSDKTTAFRMIG